MTTYEHKLFSDLLSVNMLIDEQENNIDRDYQKWLTKKLLKKASDETGIEMDI